MLDAAILYVTQAKSIFQFTLGLVYLFVSLDLCILLLVPFSACTQRACMIIFPVRSAWLILLS
jgi:hypothetical protein